MIKQIKQLEAKDKRIWVLPEQRVTKKGGNAGLPEGAFWARISSRKIQWKMKRKEKRILGPRTIFPNPSVL